MTGQQTELGVKHDKLQQIKAEREARSLLGQEDVKVDTTDAELDAHYAKLLAEGRGNAAASAPTVKPEEEPSSSRAPSLGPSAGQDDGEDEMEAVDTNVNRTEDIEAYKNSIVKGESRRSGAFTRWDFANVDFGGGDLSGRPGYAVRRCDRGRPREDVIGRVLGE